MSKETIIKELPERFVLQMRSWVITRSSVGLYTITPAYSGVPGSRIYGSRILSDFTEVSMLERALESLQARYCQAIKLFWIYEGNDLTWLGRRLGCDYRTAEDRVRKGHDQMRNDLAKREASYERRQERAHYHALPID